MKYNTFSSRRCLLSLLIMLTASVFSFHAFGQVLKGDVNSSGFVDINDALLIARYSAGLQPATFDTTVADVNCDTMINIIDALNIAKYIAGILPSLNCTPKPTPVPTRTSTIAPDCSACSLSFDGYVIDKSASLPLPGVHISLYIDNGTGQPFVTTFTDETGYYKISATACLTSNIKLYATKPEYYNGYGIDGLSLCNMTDTIDFQLEPFTTTPTPLPFSSPCPIAIEGTFADSVTRLPLAGVAIQLDLSNEGKAYFLTTDSTGFFSFRTIVTANRRYDFESTRLTASKPGYRSFGNSGSIYCGNTIKMQTVYLVPGSYTPTPLPTTTLFCSIVLSGKVISSLTGKPIAGALVSSSSAVLTDKEGNYSLVLPAPQAGITRSTNNLITIQADGYMSNTSSSMLFSCGGYSVDFSLKPLPVDK